MKTITKSSSALIMMLLLSTGAIAQDSTRVSGIITVFKNYPLNKVLIFSRKSGETAFTDQSGMFSIKSGRNDMLIISASGFEERHFRVKNGNLFKINLNYNNNDNNFESATRNGHISPELLRAVIGEHSPVNPRDYSKYNSIYDLISSEIYNLRVNGHAIVNTKVVSFDQTPEVLLVVDEKIVRDISYISPDYVKSIQFVDDAGASMYGSMGANGVLKITLK